MICDFLLGLFCVVFCGNDTETLKELRETDKQSVGRVGQRGAVLLIGGTWNSTYPREVHAELQLGQQV